MFNSFKMCHTTSQLILGYIVRNDLELIETARKTAGDHMEIMIDIGKRYRLKQALQVARALEQMNICWLEEPLPAEDFIGYKRLTESTSIPIASGEEESGRLAFARLIKESHIYPSVKCLYNPDTCCIDPFINKQ